MDLEGIQLRAGALSQMLSIPKSGGAEFNHVASNSTNYAYLMKPLDTETWANFLAGKYINALGG